MNKLSIIFLLGTFAVAKVHAQVTVPSNTISSGNYLGSANDVDVTFKRNNVFAGKISVGTTSFGLDSFAPPGSTSVGYLAGHSATGYSNSFFGAAAGYNTSGQGNVFLGDNAGASSSSGSGNTFVGSEAGIMNGSGNQNLYIGIQAGDDIVNGSDNTCIGSHSGTDSDYATPGASGNVFIGAYAGFYENSSNKLCINNSMSRMNSLIWGDFAASQLKFHGKVGIGGSSSVAFGSFPADAGSISVSNYSLFVKGGILTEEVRVSLQNTWADYVFNKDYKLPTLQDVEKHIKEKGHLINVPSAKEVAENGIELGDMAKIQQEKIEELTLYLIQQNKEIEVLKAQVKVLMETKK